MPDTPYMPGRTKHKGNYLRRVGHFSVAWRLHLEDEKTANSRHYSPVLNLPSSTQGPPFSSVNWLHCTPRHVSPDILYIYLFVAFWPNCL